MCKGKKLIWLPYRTADMLTSAHFKILFFVVCQGWKRPQKYVLESPSYDWRRKFGGVPFIIKVYRKDHGQHHASENRGLSPVKSGNVPVLEMKIELIFQIFTESHENRWY